MNNLSHLFGGNVCLGKAGLAEGTNANTIKTTATITYAINGILYTKAATDNISVSASAQANGTTCLYGIDIDASGVVSAVKGKEVSTSLLDGSLALEFPPLPEDGKCRIGLLRIVNTSGSNFTLGSVDLGATGITDTFFDVILQPSKPFLS